MGLDNTTFSELSTFAEQLADTAGPIVRRYFRREFVVERKSNKTPVTEADRAVESELRELITAQYPDHGIVGEEFGVTHGDAEFVWVIDPIDGTRAFICGLPLFGTLIALTRGQAPVLGVIDQAHMRERWIGGVDIPATLNGQRTRTSRCNQIAMARTSASSPHYFAGEDQEPLKRLSESVDLIRYGASCYGYGLLASGFVDVLIDADLDEYDYLAQVSVIEAAGGVITDWEGNALHLGCGATRVVASCTTTLHEQVLNTLSQ